MTPAIGTARLPEQAQQAEQQERPDQVELLLDRQRPQVLEHGRPLDEREVRLLGDDQVPVRDVGQRRPDLAGELGGVLAVEQQHDRRDRRPAACRRRRAAAGPGAVQKLRSEIVAVAAVLLGQQQRDQVAADDEEHLDAEEAAGQPRHVGVVQQHGDDGERPQAVEAGQVAGARPRRASGAPVRRASHDARATACTLGARHSAGDRRSGAVLLDGVEEGVDVVVLAADQPDHQALARRRRSTAARRRPGSGRR